MGLIFFKMHGAGNDFIVADNSSGEWSADPEFIRSLCDRHRGIGGDGLILLSLDPDRQSVHMTYFNSDGSPAEMCGNGLRCAASFAYLHYPGHIKSRKMFCGNDELQAEIMDDTGSVVKARLRITEPFQKYETADGITVYKGGVGVPHVIRVVESVREVDVQKEGAYWRNHPLFMPSGANVDFLELNREDGVVRIRTYERGVEEETLACGTGCASSAVVLHQFFHFPEKVSFLCYGKDHIQVEILKECCKLTEVYLIGPAKTVFRGEIPLNANTILT